MYTQIELDRVVSELESTGHSTLTLSPLDDAPHSRWDRMGATARHVVHIEALARGFSCKSTVDRSARPPVLHVEVLMSRNIRRKHAGT